MADKSTLKWVELNPASDLSKDAAKAYNDYKAIYAKAKDARTAFEDVMAEEAKKRGVTDDTTRVAFSYNFGKLSLAIAPKEAERKSGKAGPGWAGLKA